MSALVESMAYVNENGDSRNVPWHGLGTPCDHAMSSEEALELAGLNWTVRPEPVYANGLVLPGYKANIRDTDGAFLGMVGDRYQIVQNKDAFDFTDALIGEGCTYETAGSLEGGKRVFLLARMPKELILGDEVVPYLAFTNGFNGYYSIKCCATSVRVVCSNTLNLALSTAQRTWSTKHVGDIKGKVSEAINTLNLAKSYNRELANFADAAANTKLTEEAQEKIIKELFPIDEADTERHIKNIEDARNDFRNCIVAVDLSPFYLTAWGMINAASDYAYHRAPKRKTANYNEKNMSQVFDGAKFLDKCTQLCNVKY